jgi:hypothetical protein
MSAKLSSLTKELVDILAPSLNEDQRRFATDYCMKEVNSDQKGGTRREWPDVVGSLNQYVMIGLYSLLPFSNNYGRKDVLPCSQS